MSDSILDELNKAKNDLHLTQALQEQMKLVNKIIRLKISDEEKVQKLVKEMQWKDITPEENKQATAKKLLQPDFAGRVGFPQYKLTNNNANIKRLEGRVAMLEKKWEGARLDKAESYEFETGPGGTIDVNYSIDRVQILFAGKPDESIRTPLKKNGWNWSPSNGAWQRKITPQAIHNAVSLLKATKVQSDAPPVDHTHGEDQNVDTLFVGQKFKDLAGYTVRITKIEPLNNYPNDREKDMIYMESDSYRSNYHLTANGRTEVLNDIENKELLPDATEEITEPNSSLEFDAAVAEKAADDQRLIDEGRAPIVQDIQKFTPTDAMQIAEILKNLIPYSITQTGDKNDQNTIAIFFEHDLQIIVDGKKSPIAPGILVSVNREFHEEYPLTTKGIENAAKKANNYLKEKTDQIPIEGLDPLITAEYQNQYLLNKAIEQLLDERGEDAEAYTSDEKNWLRKYSGYGGLDKFGPTGKGGLFEYYTPSQIIAKMWALAYKYGYNNGPVCEPSVATGEFFQYAKPGIELTGFEISKYSAIICKIIYPQATIHLQPFEQHFIKNNWTVKDNLGALAQFDLVIGNPPYGDFSIVESRYMAMGEKSHVQPKNYVEYFLRRGLDLLRPNGLLIYIIGAQLRNGGNMFLDSGDSPVKQYLHQHAELLDAYRLPDTVFERTGVTSDIIVLKKI